MMNKVLVTLLAILLLAGFVVAYDFIEDEKLKKIKTKEICDKEDEKEVKEKKCKIKYPNDVDVDLDIDSSGVVRLDFMGISG